MERRQSRLSSLFGPITPEKKVTKYKKQKIPIAIREAVWIHRCGRVFEHKCITSWCPNTISVFDFQCGHNIPESKGGQTTLSNLYPICSRCNLSMGDRYTIDEWNALHTAPSDAAAVAVPAAVPVPVPAPAPAPAPATIPSHRPSRAGRLTQKPPPSIRHRWWYCFTGPMPSLPEPPAPPSKPSIR